MKNNSGYYIIKRQPTSRGKYLRLFENNKVFTDYYYPEPITNLHPACYGLYEKFPEGEYIFYIK